MSFLNAIFLWALPLASIPVIVHLLNRRRRDLVPWGAMQFLIEATSRRRRIWRIDDLLLMLLRAAAVLAFIFALARPLVRSNWFGTSGPRDVVLVLDTSMSTSQTNSATCLFEKQLQRAHELIDGLSDGDVVRVLLASSAPEWLAPVGIPISADSKQELRLRLSELAPTLASADMARCMTEAIDAAPADQQATRVITVLTDGQGHGWRPESADLWRGLREKLRAMPVPAVLNVVNVGDPDRAATNLSVASLTASRTLVSVGETVVLTATVRNTGHMAAGPTLIAWAQGQDELGVTTLMGLEPGQETTAAINHRFDSLGVHEVTARVEGADDLVMDNLGCLVVEVVDRVPILVVDGDPQADPFETETGFLLASLGRQWTDAARRWRSVFDATVVEASDLADERLFDYSCVVLANVSRLPMDAAGKLTDYVQSGGGLWIALGDQTDRSFFNNVLYAQGKGLSPLPLGEPAGDADDHQQFTEINPPSAQHPATRLLADTQRLDIHRAQLRRRHRFTATEDDKSVSVLLSVAQSEPLVVERTLGRGRVVVQAIPLGVDWSNLPLCHAYLVMVHEWLWYLTEPTTTQWNVGLGEPLAASFPMDDFAETAQVRTPRGRTVRVTSEVRNGQRAYRCPQTPVPGRYQMTLESRAGTRQVLPFHVPRDADESELVMLSEQESQALAQAAGLQFVEDPLADTSGTYASARAEPLWTSLLLSLLAMMLIESVFAVGLSRRRLARPAGLSAQGNGP